MPIEPPPIAALIDRAAAELAAGRPWEARYLLQSRVGREPYHPDLYEVYGRILLAIGEEPEAGPWLFLSGRRGPEYERAIHAFIGKQTGRPLYEALPPTAQLKRLADYPEPVRADLKALGVPDEPARRVRAAETWATTVLSVGCGGCIFFTLASCVVGGAVVGRWLLDRVFG